MIGMVNGNWPARTVDPSMELTDEKRYLSASDITEIHEFVWQKDPCRRVFMIQAIDKQTVLVACTNVYGDQINHSEGFDLIRSGSGWRYGTFHQMHVVRPM